MNGLKIYERNFIIYLASLIGDKIKRINDKDCINGEVYKKIHTLDEEKYIKTYAHCKSNTMPDSFFTVPDLIIHQNHEESDLDHAKQHLALEAKSEKSIAQEQFDWDFFKLNNYLDVLNYSNVVYLLIGPNISDITTYLNNYIPNDFYLSEDNNKILFVIKGIPTYNKESEKYNNNTQDGVYEMFCE